MFGFSPGFIRLVLNVSVLNYASQILFFLTALITVRSLGANLFGVLQYFTSLAAIPSLLYSHASYALFRFVPGVPARAKTELLLGSVLIQCLLLSLFVLLAALGCVVSPTLRFWQVEHLTKGSSESLSHWVPLLLAPWVVLLMLNSSLQAYLAGLQRISASQTIAFLGNAVTLLSIGAAWLLLADRQWGFIFILGARLFSQFTVFLMNVTHVQRCSSFLAELSSISVASWPSVCRRVFEDYIKRYALPLQISSAFAFVKEHLAVILLGHTGQMAWVAYYDIVQKLFDVPRKLIPDMVQTLTPRIVVAMQESREHFRRQFAQLSWLQLAFNALAGTILLFSYPVIFTLFGLTPVRSLSWLVFFFAVTLLFNAIGMAGTFVILFGEKTRPQMVASIVRSITLTLLTFVLVPKYDALGAAQALLLATAVSTAMLSISTRKTDLWPLSASLRHAAVVAGITAFWLVGVLFGVVLRPEGFGWPS